MNIKSSMTKKSLKTLEKITGGKLTLGKLMWAIREGEGETQQAFADKLGMSKQQLCDIEHNRKTISPKLAAFYAESLGYSKKQFVRLALQDMIDRDGLNFTIELKITDKYHDDEYDWAHA